MSHPVARFFGLLLMACGALIVFLAGACTLVFLGSGLGEAGRNWMQILPALPLALGIATIPILMGAALIVVGRRLWRK